MNEIKYNRIQIILVEFDIDQLELAEILQVNKNSVSRWCRNLVQPSLYQLREIAKFFRIDIRRLIEPTNWADETGLSPVEEYKIGKAKERKKDLTKKNKTTKTKKKY